MVSESAPTKFGSERARKFLEKFGGEKLSPEEKELFALMDQRANSSKVQFADEIAKKMPLKDAVKRELWIRIMD